jgi:hypothetical protein
VTFLAWGATGPEFKSRQPDQIPQRLTNLRRSRDLRLESNWSPSPGFRRLLSVPIEDPSISCRLSAPSKTRHFRHFLPNRLILFTKPVSGSSETRHRPDTSNQNPTRRCRKGANLSPFSQMLAMPQSIACGIREFGYKSSYWPARRIADSEAEIRAGRPDRKGFAWP